MIVISKIQQHNITQVCLSRSWEQGEVIITIISNEYEIMKIYLNSDPVKYTLIDYYYYCEGKKI